MKLGPDPTAPIVRFNGSRVLVAGDEAEWLAVVGIPLEASAGSKLPLSVERAGVGPSTLKFAIGTKRYATQRLTVKPGQVELSPEDLARYEIERAHLSERRKTFTDAAARGVRLPRAIVLAPINAPTA